MPLMALALFHAGILHLEIDAILNILVVIIISYPLHFYSKCRSDYLMYSFIVVKR